MSRKRTTPLRDESLAPGHCSTELRRRILGGTRYFNALSAEALDEVNARFRERHHAAGTVICQEGAPAKRLFLVAHGKVKLVRHSPEGDDVLLDILSQGALFGGVAPLGQHHYAETAVAQTDCCVLAITVRSFEELLAQHPAVTLEVLHAVADDLDEARSTIRRLATSSVDARIATVLLTLAERLGERDDTGVLIQSPLPQQDLAAMVGTTQETVSRVMAAFRRGGMISTGRQWVRIADTDALRRIAGT